MVINHSIIYNAIDRLVTGTYQLNRRDPLGEVEALLETFIKYNPRKEEWVPLRSFAIKRLKEWERDLVLGGCKVQDKNNYKKV